MNKEEALKYIFDFKWSGSKPGLERTGELMKALNNPQSKLKFVHVTGSNGKGSTCAMISAVLEQAGYKVGLYTSPHLTDFCERIQINGRKITGKELGEVTETVRNCAESMEDHPSQFELSTAIALQYFYERRCDIVVLEVGMGGEKDSTNVIDSPETAVITNIGLEHSQYLGDTIEEIAETKCGIIKQGSHVVCYDGNPKVTEIVKRKCKEQEAFFCRADFTQLKQLQQGLRGQVIFYRNEEYFLPLLGKHQACNAAVAIEVIKSLNARGYHISKRDMELGLKYTAWHARLEVLNRYPLFILDGGHNPQCAEALKDFLDDYNLGKHNKVVYIIGMLEDKDYNQMIDSIAETADEVICLTPESPRALQASFLAERMAEKGIEANAYEDTEKAVYDAIDIAGPRGTVIAFGSLYMAGNIRKLFD